MINKILSQKGSSHKLLQIGKIFQIILNFKMIILANRYALKMQHNNSAHL